MLRMVRVLLTWFVVLADLFLFLIAAIFAIGYGQLLIAGSPVWPGFGLAVTAAAASGGFFIWVMTRL